MRPMQKFMTVTALSMTLLGAPLLSSTALAQINDAGAARLNKIFTQMLDDQKAAQKLSGADLQLNGDIQITQKDSYYNVRLPAITTVSADGSKSNIGSIAVNAVPGDEEGKWKMSVAWPSPVTHYDGAGNPSLKISLGGQRMAGVFDEDLMTFMVLDSAYQNVVLENLEKGETIKIPKMDIKFNLQEKAPNIFSGPVSLTAQNVTLNKKDGTEILSLERGSVDVMVLEYNAADQKEAKEQIQDVAGRIQNGGADNISGEDKMAVMDMMVKNFESLGNGFTTQYSLKGLKIKRPDSIGTDKVQSMSFDNLVFGLDMTGFQENAVALGLRMGYKGMSMSHPNQQQSDIAPQDFALNIEVKDIPFKEITSLGKNSLETTTENPAAAQMAKMQAMMALPKLLTASNTHVSLNELSFKNKIAQAKASGKVNANAAAKAGATGYINAQVIGLDDLLKASEQAMLSEKQSGGKSTFSSLYPMLVLLRGTAEEGAGPNGEKASDFKVTLDEQGNVYINSVSLHALTGGMPR